MTGVEEVDQEEGSAKGGLSESKHRQKRMGLESVRIPSQQKCEIYRALKSEEVDEGMKHSFETDPPSI